MFIRREDGSDRKHRPDVSIGHFKMFYYTPVETNFNNLKYKSYFFSRAVNFYMKLLNFGFLERFVAFLYI